MNDATPRQRMLAAIAANPAWVQGYVLRPNLWAGDHYFTAHPVQGRGRNGEAVHVAADGSIRYSDSDRFGEFFSLGMSG